MKKFYFSVIFLTLMTISVACSSASESMEKHDMSNMENESSSQQDLEEATVDTKVLSTNEMTITAQEATLQLTKDVTVPVYTFNGSVPGSQIRIKQGETVKVHLKNELPEPVTIHWHGYPVPNNQDGVPGVTMDAVKPGETFTYEFTASVPGTYWYHSHQESAEQVDKGLYGTLIVEPQEGELVDRDYTLVLDEWMSNPPTDDEEGNLHGNMHHGHGANAMTHDMSMYDIFTINGKSGSEVEPLKVKKGEKVKLRLVNAGYIPHDIHLHGHEFKITAVDGQQIQNPSMIQDEIIRIAPGERYDIEFIADNPGEWMLECHSNMDGAKGMNAIIQYEETESSTADQSNSSKSLPFVNLTKYGEPLQGEFTLEQNYDVEYTMNLGTGMNEDGMIFTINNEIFPNTLPIHVETGDLVKVKLVNQSKHDLHPMHLHGHFFQVLSKNGVPVQGSPLIKDSLNIEPGEEYIVAFKADNPGIWMFHCHDLHHASAGMVTTVNYQDFKPEYQPDPNDTTNKGE